MSILPLTIFVGMSEFGEDLEETSFFNYFSIFLFYSMSCVTEAEVLLLLSFVFVCLMVFRFFGGS